jgi:hypothetical protein
MNPELIQGLFNREPREYTDSFTHRTIPTGSYWLDENLGGGWPVGRVSEIYGDPGVGTSTLALHALAEATQHGVCALIDRAGSFERDYAQYIGVDPDKLVVSRDVGLLADSPVGFQLVVIDGPPIPPLSIPGNQTVVLVGQGFAVDRGSSARVHLAQGRIWNGGHSVWPEIKLNAYAPLPAPAPHSLSLYYGRGFNRAAEVLGLALQRGCATRRGANYYAGVVLLGPGWNGAVGALQGWPEQLAALEEEVRYRG